MVTGKAINNKEKAKPDIETEKPDIQAKKPDIVAIKPDIEKISQPKTAGHILKLREAFSNQAIFGRSGVISVVDIKNSGDLKETMEISLGL